MPTCVRIALLRNKLQIEKNGFVRALQDYIPLSQFLAALYPLGHQRSAPPGLYFLKNKIAFVQRLLRKIDARNKPREKSPSEYRHQNVWCLPSSIGSTDGARLDRREAKSSLGVCRYTPKSKKHTFVRLAVVTGLLRIFTGSIRLPHFQHSVRHSLSIGVQHAPLNGHARSTHPAPRQFGAIQRSAAHEEEWPDGLRSGCGQTQLTPPSAWHRVHARRCQSDTQALAPESLIPNRIPKSTARALFHRKRN